MAVVENPNPDDARPWFWLRAMPAPALRQVRLAWRDGRTGSGALHPEGWIHHLREGDGRLRREPPCGWKPLGIGESHGIGNHPDWAPLPNPLDWGIEIVG